MTRPASSKKRLLAALCVALFLLSALPAACLGRYDYPSADDYSGSLASAEILREGGSWGDVVSYALSAVGEIYSNWQGNYTCSFLLNVSPALIGDTAYHLTAAACILLLFGCSWFFCDSIMRRMLGADGCDALITACVLSFMQLQFMPSPVEGLYWYTGAATYTGTFCLALLALGFSARFLYSERRNYASLAAAVVFIILAGGANTNTSFITACVFGLYLVWTLFLDRPRAGWAALFSALSAAGFAAVMLSPGNSLRVGFFGLEGVKRDLITVIGCAFKDGAYLIGGSVGVGMALCALALAPLLWRLAKAQAFRFRLPLLVVLFAFCFLSAGFSPTAYAYGEAGESPGRFVNIEFFIFCWLAALCEFYLFGWAQRSPAMKRAALWLEKAASRKRAGVVFASALALITSVWLLRGGALTSREALTAYLDGSAAAYGSQMQALIDQCRDPAVETPTSSPFTVRPLLLWHDGPTTEDIWVNDVMARFYGKQRIEITDG